nr:unnamed protein product [Digitaria exilis]
MARQEAEAQPRERKQGAPSVDGVETIRSCECDNHRARFSSAPQPAGHGVGKHGVGLAAGRPAARSLLVPPLRHRPRQIRAVCAPWAAAASAWRPRPWLVGSRTDRSGRGGTAISSFWLSPGGGGDLLPFAVNVPVGLEYLSSSHGYLALTDPSINPKAIVLPNPVFKRSLAFSRTHGLPGGIACDRRRTFFWAVGRILLDLGVWRGWCASRTLVHSGRATCFTIGSCTGPGCLPCARIAFHPDTWLLRLPPVGFFKRWVYLTTVVLSADPDTAAEWAAVAVGFPTSCLTHYTSATGAWAQIDYSVPGYTGVEHYNGRFYVAFRSQICVVEANRLVPAVIPLEHCGGELLLVSVHDDVVGPLAAVDDDRSASKSGGGTDVARAVEVYRVEWLGDAAVRLVREVDIGWYALFLGRNRAFALSAAKFPACRVNCVYLVDRQGHPDGVVRVLDVRESQWASREETIVCPDDGRRGPSSAGWARRGWFFPSY